MRIVNRVPLLHKPLAADASLAAMLDYWQKRVPGVDWLTVAYTALDTSMRMFSDAVGIDYKTMDAAIEECFAELSNRPG